MKDDDNNTQAYSAEDASRRDKTDTLPFAGPDDEDGFAAPESDAEYTTAFGEDHPEEEEFTASLFAAERDPEPADWAEPLSEESRDEPEDTEDEDLWSAGEPAVTVTGAAALDAWGKERDEAEAGQPVPDSTEHDFQATPDHDDWDDEEDYPQEDSEEEDYPQEDSEEEARSMRSWPLGLIAVAVLALLLLTAGGYGVIQQRSATQEEIRQLQAALATSVDPAEAAASREALAEAAQRNTQLQTVVDSLTLENRRLNDIVAGLESQLTVQQEALAAQVTAEQTRPEPKPEPAPAQVAAPTSASQPASPAAPISSGGGWFVNFASYGVRERAENWAGKLQPSAGKAIVTTAEKNGRNYYRVRVIDLPDRASADQVARQLAGQHGLPKLWVGRE